MKFKMLLRYFDLGNVVFHVHFLTIQTNLRIFMRSCRWNTVSFLQVNIADWEQCYGISTKAE